MWLRKVSSYDLPEQVLLAWGCLKDEETRGREVELVRGGWPQGEALDKAVQLSEISWTVGPQSRPEVPAVDRPGGNDSPGQTGNQQKGKGGAKSGGKQIVTCSQLPGGQFVCKKWNDPRGCTKHEASCPDKKKHVCDVRKPDGKACGAKNHRRDQCHFIEQHQGPNHRYLMMRVRKISEKRSLRTARTC